MEPRQLDRLRFAWHDHRAALWWLRRLYGCPAQVKAHLERLPHLHQQLRAVLVLWLHALPYLLGVCLMGRLVAFELVQLPHMAPWHSAAFYLARGLGLGLAFGLITGTAVRIATGTAGGLTAGLAIALIAGTVDASIGGIAFDRWTGHVSGGFIGMVAGLSFGVVVDIASGATKGWVGLAKSLGAGAFLGGAGGMVAALVTTTPTGITTLEVSVFTPGETYQLLTDPLKDSPRAQTQPRAPSLFSEALWGERGIERIHQEAGGWPHLVQLIAQSVVHGLNEERTRHVSPELFHRAIERATDRGRGFFDEVLEEESRLPGEWDYLLGFRNHPVQRPPADEAVRQSLRRRQLIREQQGQWQLCAPLMQCWLRQQR